MAEDSNCEFPVLAYLSAARVWSQRRERTDDIFRKIILGLLDIQMH